MRRRQIEAARKVEADNLALKQIREAIEKMTAEDIGGTEYQEPRRTLTLKK